MVTSVTVTVSASSDPANRMRGKRLETDAYVNSEATYIRTDLIPILM